MPNPCAPPSNTVLPAASGRQAGPDAAPASTVPDGQFAKVLQRETGKASGTNAAVEQNTAAMKPLAPTNASADAAGMAIGGLAALLAMHMPLPQMLGASVSNKQEGGQDQNTVAVDANSPSISASTAVGASLQLVPGLSLPVVQTNDKSVPKDSPTTRGPANATAILAATATPHDNIAVLAETKSAPSPVTEDSTQTGSAHTFQTLLAAAETHVRGTIDPGASTAAMTSAVAASASPHAGSSTPISRDPPALTVATAVGSEGWASEVGDKLTWMVGNHEQRAELVLNPPQLGRIEVSISMNGDQANATFVSANPAVRDAIENAMPQLRELMASAGVSLGQTHVGSESAGQTAQQQQNGDNSWRGAGSDALQAATLRNSDSASRWLSGGRGLVDVFA